jgi:signal transduction histidine kinase
MEGWRRNWDELSLGNRFRILFLLTYVPVLILGGTLMIWLYLATRQGYFTQVDRHAQLAYASLERWYAQQIAFLGVLANTPEVRAGPGRDAYFLLRLVDQGAEGWLGVSMLDGSGRILLSTLRPYGSPPVDLSDRDYVQQALRTGQPTMSGFTNLPFSPSGMLTLVYPYEQGASRRLLAIHYDPRYIADFFSAPPFQGRVVVTLLDAEGRRLARPQIAGPLGEQLVSPAMTYILTHDQGEQILVWHDGIERITAFYRYPSIGWTVVAGIPVADSLGMIRRMLLAILGIGILGFGLVFWMLQLGIRQASRPIALLVDKARRIGDGEQGVRVPALPSRELNALGQSFNQMAEEIARSHSSLEAQVDARTFELSQALQQLKTLDRLKDTFLSTISHEMKTPLSLIIGYTELLQDKYPDEELLKGLQDGSRRLTTHINNMLDYSALLGGSLPLYKTEVSIPEVARNALDIMETEFKLANLQVDAQLAPDVPPVCGDSRRITQMFMELLDNARKNTPSGGRIGVEVMPHDGDVRIVISDTGRGIKREDLGRIWEAFNQLEAGSTLKPSGLGLGLTIVKKLAELHHGRVSVESQPGRGSRFTIDLPADCGPNETGA